jgi:hypothetical protein
MTRPSHPRHTPEQLELFTFAVGQQPPGDSRVGLIKTLQYRVRASSDLPLSARIELRAILERVKSKADDDDARVIAACRCVRDAAPRIWAESKPVLDALIGQRARLTLEIEVFPLDRRPVLAEDPVNPMLNREQHFGAEA